MSVNATAKYNTVSEILHRSGCKDIKVMTHTIYMRGERRSTTKVQDGIIIFILKNKGKHGFSCENNTEKIRTTDL